MDVASSAADCGHGIGGTQLQRLQRVVRRPGQQLTLHAESANPPQRPYRRAGFTLIENRGVYDSLGRKTPAADT